MSTFSENNFEDEFSLSSPATPMSSVSSGITKKANPLKSLKTKLPQFPIAKPKIDLPKKNITLANQNFTPPSPRIPDFDDQFSLASSSVITSATPEPIRNKRIPRPNISPKMPTMPANLPLIGGIAGAVGLIGLLIFIPIMNNKKSSKMSFGAPQDTPTTALDSLLAPHPQRDTTIAGAGDTSTGVIFNDPDIDSIKKEDAAAAANVEISQDSLDIFIKDIMTLFFAPENEEIPKTLRDRISFYTTAFSKGPGRSSMAAIMKRKEEYFPHINRIFNEYHIPDVIRYVAMQESYLNPKAQSHVGAAGMWQFMPATGRLYGLTVNDAVDERLDWQLATEASAKYFRKLLINFGKGDGVLLAIASYNAGEGKIQKALQQVPDPLRDRNFTYLYRTSTMLAKETREYVPQVLARAIIDRNPEYFGF